MKRVFQVIESHAFKNKDFIGGEPALDFINTVTGRDLHPRDWLDGYARLLDWAGRVELLPESTLRRLADTARSAPDAAAAALQRAKELRETLFLIVTRLISGKVPEGTAIALLTRHWRAGADAHALQFEAGRLRLVLSADCLDLDALAHMIAYRFVDQVLSMPIERLRICQGRNCSWLFVDRSKAGRRRWCDMSVCGNTAKSHRFRARHAGGNDRGGMT